MKVALVKSFSINNSGGNGAGVVILEKFISDEEKQEIATRVGLSETAFVLVTDENNYDVSFFTPMCEVELCGHATIAAFYYLGILGYINGKNETKTVYQNTKAGRLKIDITFKGEDVDYVLMQQKRPEIYGELKDNIKQIADSLNTDEKLIRLNNHNIYPTIVSTGLKDILVPVISRDVLNSIIPNFKMIKDISEENDVVGYHVYTIDEGNIYARNFAPKVGIDEECATGTSNGALASLLYVKGILKKQYEIIQGESMNEKSLIFVNVNLQTIVFILIIAALVQFVEMFLKKSAPGLYQALGIFLPLITTNCAVLGVAINNIIYEYEFIDSLVYSVGTSAGFLLAIVLFAGVRDKVDYADLPESLKGSAISLVTAGLMSIAFLGFSGLQL